MRILIVAADERLRRTLGRSLAGLSRAAVVVEGDAGSAIEQTHVWHPHLAIVELEMRNALVDSVRCALALRIVAPALPIFFVGHDRPSHLGLEARSIPATVHFSKPLATDELLHAAEMFRP